MLIHLASPPRFGHIGIGIHQPGEATYTQWPTACMHLHRYPGEFTLPSGTYRSHGNAVSHTAPLATFTHRWSQADSTHITLHYRPAPGPSDRALPPLSHPDDFEALWESLIATLAWQSTAPGRAQARLWEVLWNLSQPIEPQQRPEPFDLALRIAYEEPSIAVNAICARTGLDRHQLNAFSRSHLGCTFKQHLLEVRLEQAQKLLKNTNLPLKAIAQSLGYTNPYAFNKDFHHRLGCSPSSVRRTSKS